jgi:hypothetical protein
LEPCSPSPSVAFSFEEGPGWDGMCCTNIRTPITPFRSAVKATGPGHATTSGVVSHLLAVSVLVGTGLFASVLAPPAATGIIRDLAVRTGSKPYPGLAGKLVKLFWHPTSPSAAHAVVARNYRTHASKPNNTTHTNTRSFDSVPQRFL